MSAQLHLYYIPLVNGKNLAGPRTANTIGRAPASLGEHRTSEEQVTTGSALATAT